VSTETSNADKARDLASGLRRLADLIGDNPDLYGDLSNVGSAKLLCYVLGSKDVRDRMVAIAHAALAAGAEVSERADDPKWANLDLRFGPLKVQVYTDKSWLGAVPAPPVEVPGYTPLLSPTCGEACCTFGEPRSAHRCTRPTDHVGDHVSSHLSWGDSDV
jgi:hypothetical protein